jgi:hypothetical protein
VSADINQLLRDYRGITGHWIATDPHHPIKLLAGILKWHGKDNLDDRPAPKKPKPPHATRLSTNAADAANTAGSSTGPAWRSSRLCVAHTPEVRVPRKD